MKLHYKL